MIDTAKLGLQLRSFFNGRKPMPRIKVEGILIGCPVAHHELECPRCGGGWPGTVMPADL